MALREIEEYKKSLLEQKRLELAAYQGALIPTAKSLYQALLGPKASFICEIKFASPSKGLIRAKEDLNHIASIYADFASAISVLADEKYFGGSLSYVKEVSERQACPILCKDVVVSPLQVYEARAYGADVVLLMLSVLDDETYRQCAAAAQKFKMDIICEVHTEEEMERANRLAAPIIGINNRNLIDLSIDLSTSERLLPLAHKEAKLIVESGMASRRHIKNFSKRAHGFLIGTSLMKAERIDLALRELIFGRVKICGLTNAQDAEVAYRQGAYYGGLNFSPKSPRMVLVEQAKNIKSKVPLKWGGVFLNQALELVGNIAQDLKLDFVQLHGDENEGYIKQLRKLLPAACEIWKALRVRDGESLPVIDYADRVLLDSFKPQVYGGTGQAFDWRILAEDPRRHEYIVAGGINKDNVERVSALEPFVIDIASGSEEENPREKSEALIREIFSRLHP